MLQVLTYSNYFGGFFTLGKAFFVLLIFSIDQEHPIFFFLKLLKHSLSRNG